MATIVTAAGAAKNSAHFGTIGDRVRVEGVVRKMIGGKPVMHIIDDVDGNQFICRRGSALARSAGALVTIEATVLEHRIFGGIKQTVVSGGEQEMVTDTHAFRVAGR